MIQTSAAAHRNAPLAAHSIAVYVAPLVEGQRVAVVGPSSVEVARRLRALGAQSVVALGGAGEGVALRPLNPGAIEAFRGRVDCVVVPDAEAVPFAAVLHEARKALGREGLLVVAVSARARASVGYHALRESLEERFSVVKMLGCGSFSAISIASYDDAPEDLTLDTRLMPESSEEPDMFVGLASDGALAIDPFAIIQVPTQRGATSDSGRAPAEATELRSQSAALVARLEEAERALGAAQSAQRAASERASAAAVAADNARQELATTRADLRRTEKRVGELERELDEAEASSRALRAQLEQAERARDAARKDLHRARHELREREQSAGEDVQRLERAVAERGRECEALRAQVQDRDAAVRELLFQIDALQTAEGSQRMAALEARNAELGALHAAVGAEAGRLAQQNDVLRERVARLESVIEAREAETKQLEFQLAQARAAQTSVARAREEALVAQRQAEELSRLRAEYEARLAAARADEEAIARRVRAEVEAERSLEQIEQAARAARAREEADEEAARLRAELESQRRRAIDAELALKSSLERLSTVEAAESDARARAASAETRLAEQSRLLATTSQMAASVEELAATKAHVASLETALGVERERRAELARSAEELRAQLDSALRAEEDLQTQLSTTRAELSRQLALSASLEERSSQLELELEGTKKGYTRRVRELEREVEQRVRAREVASSSASEEGKVVVSVLRELDAARAERNGLVMRLSDAEAALVAAELRARALSDRPSSRPTEAPPDEQEESAAPNHRAEQLLATLAETAARLASTEETLGEVTGQLHAAQAKVASLEEELRAARASAERSAPAAGASVVSAPELEVLRRESAERELLVRSLVAQLEDRDLRLRALERRLVEEVERARRTESEIWELELRARDQRIAAMQREIERGAAEAPRVSVAAAAEDPSLREQLARASSEAEASKRALEQVRSAISTILVDGRGAGISHELVALLRRLDEPESN
jgi:chromosome segregation ATPase